MGEASDFETELLFARVPAEHKRVDLHEHPAFKCSSVQLVPLTATK
jgi:hypothetical protein